MTELQMGLIGFGAIIVLGVLAYNKWQESKHRKIADRMRTGVHADALLDESAASAVDGGVEADATVLFDTFSVSAHTATPVLRASSERIEPVLSVDLPDDRGITEALREIAAETPLNEHFSEPDHDSQGGAESVAAHVSPTPESLDTPNAYEKTGIKKTRDAKEVGFPFHFLSPLIDYVACFETIEAASAYQILDSQRDFLQRVRKPIHWVGYNEHCHEWESIHDNGKNEYRRLCVGLQLVDRNGPVREVDLSVFHLAMQDLAEELMAIVDLPPRQYVLELAAQLDQFSAAIDIQIGLNVISQDQPFVGTKLRALAEAAGMTFDNEGHFVRCDDEGKVLYRLFNQLDMGFSVDSIKTLTTHGVTFLLDVPRVAHGDRVFNQMLDLARRFTEALHGSLVDDNRRPLSEGELEPIRRQIVEYQEAMASRSLPAGGHLALRLFS